MMTDVWCFTCSHEIRQELGGNWVHVDDDDIHPKGTSCVCVLDGLECQP